MTAARIKEDLHLLIEESDTRLLKVLYAVAKEYKDEDFTVPGKPMSVAVLKERVEAAHARIEAGHFTTQSDLEKEVEQW